MTEIEICFLDGKKRIVKAPTFSSAIAIAAYERYREEGSVTHKELSVDEKQCRQINGDSD